MSSPARPFARYPRLGAELLGIPGLGGGTARHGYGLPVFAQCGYDCVYCGRNMAAPYESWLDLSVDHVVPNHLVGAGWPREWVYDLINLVTCCRACNEFLNGYRVIDTAPPATFAEFVAIRDRVFDEKAARAADRHAVERGRYTAARATGPSEVQQDVEDVTSNAYRMGMAETELPSSQPDLLSLAQAAQLLGRSATTLRNQVLSGRLNAVKLGHDWLVTREEVERYRAASLGRFGRRPSGD